MIEAFDPLAIAITVPSVIALVNWAKLVGLRPGRSVPILSMILGIVLNVGQELVTAGVPITAEFIWSVVMVGVFIGLGASGVHDVAKRASGSGANFALADSLNTLFTGGGDYEDDRANVVEQLIGDTVYAGPANTMVEPGSEVRPADILGLTPLGEPVEPQRAHEEGDLVM